MNRALSSDWARALEYELQRWGATFERMTSAGHKRYRLGSTYVDLTDSGSDWREQRNLHARIKRAVRTYRTEHPGAQPREVRTETAHDEAWLTQPAQPHVPFGTSVATPEVVASQAVPDAGPQETAAQPPEESEPMIKCKQCDFTASVPQAVGAHVRHTHGAGFREAPRGAPRTHDAVAAAQGSVAERAVATVALLVRENADLRARIAEIEQSLGAIGVLRDKAKEALRGR